METVAQRPFRIVGWFVLAQGAVFGVWFTAAVGGGWTGGVASISLIACVLGGLLPMAASLLAACNPRIAARIFLSLTPFTILLFQFLLGSNAAPEALGVVFGAIIFPAVYWRMTAGNHWPAPLSLAFLSRHRPAIILAATEVYGLSMIVAFFWSLSLPWWPLVGDCVGWPLLDAQGRPSRTDFSVRVLFIGPRTYLGYSLWSVARVEERFSDSSPRSAIIILRHVFGPTDSPGLYLVEGRRSRGALTQFLPVYERDDCGHTGRADRAAVELRILRAGPPKTGARLIGRVYDRALRDGRPVAGIAVPIEGPSKQTFVLTTDAEGIYDQSGLPPGRYKLHLPESQRGAQFEDVVELREGDSDGRTMYLK